MTEMVNKKLVIIVYGILGERSQNLANQLSEARKNCSLVASVMLNLGTVFKLPGSIPRSFVSWIS